MEARIAFYFFILPLVFLYPLHFSWRRKKVFLSWSNLGSALSLALKACSTCETVVLIIPWTRIFLFLLLKVASQSAWEKAESMIFLWKLVNLSRKNDHCSPTTIRKVFQQRHTADWLLFVSLTNVSTQATAAELIQRTKLFLWETVWSSSFLESVCEGNF